MELTVRELKQKILDSGVTEEKLKERFEELKETSFLYKSENGKRMAYTKIAKENKVPLQAVSVNVASETFPMSCEEALDTDKQNFSLSGYVISGFRPNKYGDMFMDIADKTGVVTIKVFASNMEALENVLDTEEIDEFTFVKLKNLSWKDKKWKPTFGDNSSIEKAEETFPFHEAMMHTTADRKNDKIYALKMYGMIISAEPSSLFKVYHCEAGHRFKGMSENEVGSLATCEKCEKPMEVQYHVNGKVLFGDRNGMCELEISVFSGIDSIEEDTEVFIKGKYNSENDTVKVWELTVIKKN
jgi:hypothetical protein